MNTFLQRLILVPFMAFLLVTATFGQFVFPPESIWEFDHNQIVFSGPFEGYSRWEATDRDTLYKGQVWQVVNYFNTSKEYKATKIDTTSGELFLRKDSFWLAVAGLPEKNGDRDTFRHIWLLDGENPGPGQIVYTPGDFCEETPITIQDVDTVDLMGHEVQRYTFVEWGDTFSVYPYPGLIERKDKYMQHAYYGRELNLPLPEWFCVSDAGYSWLACFTFPNGTKWVNQPNCGKLISALENEIYGQSWTLTPNPTVGITHLTGPGNSETLHLKLFTLTGTEAASFILPVQDGKCEFDVTALPVGWYLLEIFAPNGMELARIPLIKG